MTQKNGKWTDLEKLGHWYISIPHYVGKYCYEDYNLRITEIPVLQGKVCFKDHFNKKEQLPFLFLTLLIIPQFPRITLAFIPSKNEMFFLSKKQR